MRVTIVLPDDVGERARSEAQRQRVSLSALVARALRLHLNEPQPGVEPALPFRLLTVGGLGLLAGVDLDHTSGLLTAEDELSFRQPRGG